MTSRSTSVRATTRGTSDCAWRPTAICSRPSAQGKADVVTDTIERFTKTGIKLASGEELQADIIVTATGLNLQLFGGAAISRNGEPVELNDTMAYKGMMLTAHAEHGVHDRLHQRVVDAEGRPGVGVRLPRAELHGRQRL